ncbi:T9SS type A sorting domain-containing protein [Flavitalea sp. BT771]|uniref:T9SS type A sorting domain-containing protein n=1 Tax=Flavitalea sp. BT771 TaxID=3063329 RepID=UPI0026E3D59F|nr:T9SS type A sorting domain-containing protein [Flavitalea sp. BT771]MDO6432977.1 T9SS type A sorting domain-containing protein [Flavitalea sp. BT771]MDV6221747.1 T9SS type A sorting domain-containing protein [Flavitalea sp. BT771]
MKTKSVTVAVLIMAVLCCSYSTSNAQGCASSAGANNATSFSTAAYGSFPWTNAGNAQASDGNYASATQALGVLSSAYSDYLIIENFGFSIPSTATICEIRVEVERSATGLGIGGSKVTDQSIRLLQNGTLYGGDLASGTTWPSSDGIVTYGIGTLASTWGGSWQPSDVNSANFGVAISAKLTTGLVALGMTAKIDRVRIMVIYDPNTVLALGLENFTATRSPDGDGHRLTWTAATDVTGARFVIQRSGNAHEWQDIATIAASAPDHSYTYIDHTPLNGANFYRIRMEDAGKRSVYSTVSEVRDDRTAFRCWPNPFTDLIHLSGPPDTRTVTLKDLQGRVLYTTAAAAPTGEWQIPAGHLRPGLYFMQVGNEMIRILKQ